MRHFIFLIVTVISINAFSQTEKEQTNKPFTVIKDSNNKLKELVFYDTINNFKIKSIDLTENNPYYKKLKLDNTVKTEQSSNLYNVNEASLNSIILPADRKHYHRTIKEKDIKINQAMIEEIVYHKLKNKVAVGYTLGLAHDFYMAGVSSEIYIYDYQGNKVNSIINIDVNINRFILTNEGNYLCFSYGVEDESGIMLKDGFRIYDLKQNKLIVDNKIETTINTIGLYSPVDDLLIVTLNEFRKQTAIVYDFEKNNIYTRIFSKDEFLKIKSKGKDGYKMVDENGKINLETYLKTFSVEELQY
ncbi:MAG TPA: hypothetical protein DCG75_01235 [Bacteroidales bacterium]|nr:hypothetical protein [Bacteroidales bacterium]